MDDREIRLECLRMATQLAIPSHEVLPLARVFHRFVTNANQGTSSASATSGDKDISLRPPSP